MLWGMIEMSINCPECDAPVHIDGPYRKVFCRTCRSDIDFPEEVWKDLLEDVGSEIAEFNTGEGSNSNIFGHFNMKMTYGRLDPYCSKCKRDFGIEKDFNGTDKLVCPDCGTEVPLYEAPDWFKKVISGAGMIAGAWPEEKEPGGDIQAVSDPVAFSCPKCGGSLLIDGAERLVKCEYCETRVYLPDDLWLTLHPAKKKNRWFIGLK